MKKITFITEDISFRAGVERVQAIIANELAKEYDVEIISLFNEKDDNAYRINENVKVTKLFHKIKRKYFKFLYVFLYIYLKFYFRNFRTDVLIVTEVRTFSIFKFMRKKTNLMVWEHLNSYIGKEIVGKFYEIGRKDASKFANKIIVLTDKDKAHYKELYNIKDPQIIRIYNPIEMINQTHKYDINSKKILSIGRISGQKGFDYLVEIAKIVFEKHSDWQWHIYGEGPEKEKIQILINNNKLEKNIILMGQTNQMQNLYKNYSIFVMTSRFEGFPMVNIEAHSAKLPIVSFDCPCGPSEMIIDGVNGYLIDCFDVEKMAEKINYLIENPDIRQKMSDNTSKDKEKLKMENIIEEWKKIL